MGGYQRFGGDIPVPDCPREEAILKGVFTCRRYMKGKSVLISAAPSLGNKVFCGYPVFAFQTFV